MSEREAQARKEAREDSRSMKNKFSRMIPAEKCEFCNKSNVVINYKLDIQAANLLRRLLTNKMQRPSQTELKHFNAASHGTCQSCLQVGRYILHLHTYVRNWDLEQLLADVNKYLE